MLWLWSDYFLIMFVYQVTTDDCRPVRYETLCLVLIKDLCVYLSIIDTFELVYPPDPRYVTCEDLPWSYGATSKETLYWYQELQAEPSRKSNVRNAVHQVVKMSATFSWLFLDISTAPRKNYMYWQQNYTTAERNST